MSTIEVKLDASLEEAIRETVVTALGDTLAQAGKRLYRRAELAGLLGVSESTIISWVKTEGFPELKIGKVIFYDIDDVIAFIKNKK